LPQGGHCRFGTSSIASSVDIRRCRRAISATTRRDHRKRGQAIATTLDGNGTLEISYRSSRADPLTLIGIAQGTPFTVASDGSNGTPVTLARATGALAPRPYG